MTGNQHFCPKCGTSNKIDAKFCRSCGEKLATAGSSTVETVQKAADVVNTVASTVSKVESTVSTAGKIAQTAGEISQVVIRPPAEWKVVVGDMLPTTGQKMVESAVAKAEQQVQQQVQQKVQEEVVKQVSKVVSKQEPAPESFVPTVTPSEARAPPPLSSGPACSKCGKPIKPGAKFCGSCGAACVIGAPAENVVKAPAAPVCPSCGNPLAPGKKFCGSCGWKIV